MMRTPVLAGLLWALCSAPAEANPRQAAPALSEAEATFDDDFQVTVDLVAPTPNYRTYKLEVTPEVASVELTLSGARGDLDLFANFGQPMPGWFSAHHRADSPHGDEVLVLSRDGTPRLRTGTYYVDVARGDGPTTAVLTGRFERGYDGPEITGRLPDPSLIDDIRGEIRQNSAFRLNIDEDPRYRSYVVHVPQDARSLLIRATGARADIDLLLRHGQPIVDLASDPDHRADSFRFEEQIYLRRGGKAGLRPGRYFLDVVRAAPPGDVGPVLLEVLYDQPEPAPLPALTGTLRDLALGERASVDLSQTSHRGARFRFQVPEGAQSLDVRVLAATRDVDLFLRKGQPVTDHHDPAGHDVSVVTPRLNERLVLDASSDPPLTSGTWYLDVASLLSSDRRIAFDLIVTVDGEVPLDHLRLPPFFEPDALTPIERVLQAVVQVGTEWGGGSGTCLTPDGYILTNHHVIARGRQVQRDNILISFIDDFDETPEQLFVAELVASDPALDLALLKIHMDVFDRPLPDDLALPWLPIGDPGSLRHGDPLYIAGFPSVGGFESRTSISLTRGIVSGLVSDQHGRRAWIKTDARINAGNSGGTALDAELRFVGVPSLERVEADDELGYARSTTMIPQAWLDLLEGR